MGAMSKEKGKVGEREVATLLRGHGVEARRGQQFSGGDDSPDVVHSMEGLHLEVKRTEKLQLWQAFEQANRDAGGDTPVVVHRANRRPWVAILPLGDLVELWKKANQK